MTFVNLTGEIVSKTSNENLWKIFYNINNWLEFSEKKNSLLLSINSIFLTFLTIYLRFYVSSNQLKEFRCALILFLVFLLISIFFALVSFFPKSKLSAFSTIRVGDDLEIDTRNLVFYAHIATFSKQEYILALKNRYGDHFIESNLDKDIVEQILINSEIVDAKFTLFKRGFFFLVLELITLFVIILKVVL